ncbi:MAG: hypothetical protein JNM50_10600 [Chromatiales bacterium]|nr:hypothetical protein [Chromatiales bacterium]
MTLLDQILDLTAAIEASVDGGDWAGAASLDTERRALLGDLLATQPGGVVEPAARAVLADLVRRNQATVTRVERERQAVGMALRQLHDSPAAVRAYTRAAPAPAAALAGSETP